MEGNGKFRVQPLPLGMALCLLEEGLAAFMRRGLPQRADKAKVYIEVGKCKAKA